MAPIVFLKLQRFCADPYTSQIELKLQIQCIGTIRQLLAINILHLNKKTCFSLHPNVQAVFVYVQEPRDIFIGLLQRAERKAWREETETQSEKMS